MKLRLPDTARLQNIEGFIGKYSPMALQSVCACRETADIHARPFALAMAACAGALAKNNCWTTTGSIPKGASLPRLVQ